MKGESEDRKDIKLEEPEYLSDEDENHNVSLVRKDFKDKHKENEMELQKLDKLLVSNAVLKPKAKTVDEFVYNFFGNSLLMILIVLFSYNTYLLYEAQTMRIDMDKIVPMTTLLEETECMFVDKDTIKKIELDEEWTMVKKSMKWHLKNSRTTALNAKHLGMRYCYTMLRRINNDTIGMYNMNISSIDLDSLVSIKESSVSCPELYSVLDRSRNVMIEFVDENSTHKYFQRFSDYYAFALQSAWHHNRGLSVCKDGERGDLGVTSSLIML